MPSENLGVLSRLDIPTSGVLPVCLAPEGGWLQFFGKPFSVMLAVVLSSVKGDYVEGYIGTTIGGY